MMIKVCNGHAVSLSELLETVVEHVKDLEAKLGDEIQDADRITMSAFELKEKLVALQKLRDQDRTEVEKLYEERAALEAAVAKAKQERDAAHEVITEHAAALVKAESHAAARGGGDMSYESRPMTVEKFVEYAKSYQDSDHWLEHMSPDLPRVVEVIEAMHDDQDGDTSSYIIVRLDDGRYGRFSEWADYSGHG